MQRVCSAACPWTQLTRVFFQAVPQKPLITTKWGENLLCLSFSLYVSRIQAPPPLGLLRNNRSESAPTPPRPSSPFLSLRWRSRTMWSPPIATAQRRPASSCVKQRDSGMTDWPKVGANIVFHIGGAAGGEILSQTGLVLLMITHNLPSLQAWLLGKTAYISLTPHNPVSQSTSCQHLLLLSNCKAKTWSIKGRNRERILVLY